MHTSTLEINSYFFLYSYFISFIYICYSQSWPSIKLSDTPKPSSYTDTEHWSPSHEKFLLIKEKVKFFIEDKEKDEDKRTRSEVLRDIVRNLFQGSGGNLDLGVESATAGSDKRFLLMRAESLPLPPPLPLPLSLPLPL